MSADVVTPPPVTPPKITAAPAAPAPRPVSRRRRWLKRLLPLVALLTLGVWFAPMVVAKTSLRNRLAQKALADVRGTVDVGSASLGWFSQVELRDVTIKDEAGRTLVSVPKITSQKDLFDLARNRADMGEIALETPTIAVVCEKGTTNLEVAFAKYLEDRTEPAATRPALALRVTGGTLSITDGDTNKTASIEGIAATVGVPASRIEQIAVKLTASTGNLDVDVSAGDPLSIKLVCAGLPLEPFAPLLKRADPDLTLAGTLTANVRVTQSKDSLTIVGEKTLSAKQLAVTHPALGGDTLRFASADLSRVDVELTGRVVTVKRFDLTCDAGTLSAVGTFNPAAPAGDAVSAQVTCAGLKLDAFAPLLKRLDPDLKIAGTATADLQVKWSKDALAVAGSASAKQLAVTHPALNGDTLRFDAASLPLDVELAGRVVKVRKFDLTCDAGTLSAAGTFDPDQPTEKLFAQPGVVLGANVDLAKLAAKLPKLLRVKGGTEVQEGKLVATVASRADGKGVVWDGKINASALKATRAGKPLVWDQPLDVKFAGRYTPGRLLEFDEFICTSDCIAVNARIKEETVQVAANVYLHRLGERLADFVNLDGITLDGEASATLVGQRQPDGTFAARGAVALKNFAYTDGAGKGLKEPALTLNLAASGKWVKGAPVELKTATLTLAANADKLELALLEPIGDVANLSSGSVELRVGGDLARWKARAAAFTRIPPYQMSGTLAANGRAKFTPNGTTVDRLTVGLTNLKFRGAGLNLDEPIMNAVGDLAFTRANKTATITKLTITSAPLTVTEGTLTFEFPEAGVIVSGSGPCETDLNRLGASVKVYADARGPDALHGTGRGPLRFRYTGEVTTFGGTLDVTNFAYGLKDKPDWREPTLRLDADGSYTDSTDTVALTVAKVDRPGLVLDAKGAVAKVTTAQEVNFAGTVRYDWAKLTPQVRDLVGGGFTATGTGSKPFAVSGTLAPPGAPPTQGMFAAMNGQLALGWDALRAYGFDVGAGDLSAKMTRGVIAVAPLAATFGGGKVTLAPTLKLDTSPGELILVRGPLIERAKLTPQATAGALGFALPAIANTGVAEGEISATLLDECRVPLGDFTKTTLKGTLVIHRATVGASPVVAEVAKLLGAKATTMTLANEESVPVEVKNGRVYHQNFSVKVSGTTFRTSGSVGFDKSLDLVVDVPLPKDLPLLKNNPLLSKAVSGKVVKVPVKGTLAQPVLDPKAFEQAVVALAREGAKDVGKDLLDKELNKLFPGMPAPKGGGGFPFPLPFGKKP